MHTYGVYAHVQGQVEMDYVGIGNQKRQLLGWCFAWADAPRLMEEWCASAGTLLE